MLKGVNKKVIEVRRTDSAYFERAVLYLRPEVSEVPAWAAQIEIQELLHGHGRRNRGWLWFLLGAAAAAGAFAAGMLWGAV